jgi:glycosyltransferase involved in cell wall biosynthesis
MRKLVTVVIHSFNRFDYLSNALNSVFNQSIDDYEVILINDESTDERYYKHNFGNKVKQIDIKRNSNPRWTGSRQSLINIGVAESNGKYIALLDDDDCWLEKKLETQITQMEESYFKFSSTEGYFGYGQYMKDATYDLYNKEHFLKVLKKRYRFTKYLKNGQLPRIWTEDFLKVHNCVVKSSAVIETELLKMIGGFRGIPKKSDYDCWLNVIKVEDLLYIDEPLFYYDGAHGSGQYY